MIIYAILNEKYCEVRTGVEKRGQEWKNTLFVERRERRSPRCDRDQSTRQLKPCRRHRPPRHLSSILPLVSQSREGLWVPEVRHTIYSMESLGRF